MKSNFIDYMLMAGRYSILAFFTVVAFSATVLAGDSYGQELHAKEVFLTVNAEQQTVEDIFKIIEEKTNFRFIYNSGNYDFKERISIKADHKSLLFVLKDISQKTGLEFKQFDNYISVRYPNADDEKNKRLDLPVIQSMESVVPPQKLTADYFPINARDTVVNGKVVDEKGLPLPGVTVQVKGTQLGAVTDEGGLFHLEAPVGDTLIFTSIGYEQKRISFKGIKNLLVKLNPAAAGLNEVVVVGYGTQQKQDVTSAVSQVSGEEIRRTPTVSIQNALSGKLPGFFSQQRSGQPGGGSAANIYIRGVGTFTDETNPLVLVDNVEYNFGQLFLIDPNEVKSVTILKDASATAIYGIKGANGVILITTRRGEAGKPVIRFKTQVGVQTPVHKLKTLDAYQSALLQNEGLRNAGQPPLFSVADLMMFKNGMDPYGHPDVDWTDELLRKSTMMTNNNLDISGGGKRVRYFISLGYLWQNGLVKDIPYNGPHADMTKSSQINNNYYMKRYKFRSNLDIDATNTLHLQLDLTGSKEEANYPEGRTQLGNIYNYYNLNPYMYPVYNPNGTFGWGDPNRMVPSSGNNVAGAMALGGYSRNDNDFMDVHVSGDQKLDILTKGLSLKAEVAFSYANGGNRKLSRSNVFPSYWFDSQDSTYHAKDPNVSRIAPYDLSYSGGTPNQRLNLQGALNYERSFGNNNVGGLLLFNQTSYYKGANPPDNFRGYTFRFTYNYRHKYLLQVSGAYNGSSKFVSQKRYNMFPAVSLGYNIAKESFFENLFPFMDAFKLRGSYGRVGTDLIGSGFQYLYESKYRTAPASIFGESPNSEPGIEEDQLGNNDVTWQTERKADVGIDFSLWKGKFSGSVDYFDNYRYNILSKKKTVPLYFGITADNLPPVNIGRVSNKGFEVELNYKTTIGRVGIHAKGTYSYAKNKILYIDEPPVKYPWLKQTGTSVGTPKQYEWTGTFYMDQPDIDTSATPSGTVHAGYLKYKDLNNDGIINQEDMAYSGYPNLPNTNLGLTLGLNYKGFSFSVLLQSALNFDVYAGFDKIVPFRTVMQPIHLDRWTPETAETATFPLMTTVFNGSYMNPRDNLSSYWTVSGDYLRIKSAYLSYNFPQSMVEHIGLSGLQVFLNGFNLFTWSKIYNRYQFDPETDPESNDHVYPVQRIFNFGLNLTFK